MQHNVPTHGERVTDARRRLYDALGPTDNAERGVIDYLSRALSPGSLDILVGMIERAVGRGELPTSGGYPDAMLDADTDGGEDQLARDQEIGDERRARQGEALTASHERSSGVEEWQPRKVSLRELAGIIERETGARSLALARLDRNR